MKRLRFSLLVLAALALLAGVAWWAQRRSPGFADPAECVEAYREACAAGDVAGYLACLADPVRAEAERTATPAALQKELAGVVSWAQREPSVSGAAAHVDVERGRRDGVQRIRFQLRRCRGGWSIVGIDSPQPVPTVVPYGTHVSKVP
jgi:hypothetical protein